MTNPPQVYPDLVYNLIFGSLSAYMDNGTLMGQPSLNPWVSPRHSGNASLLMNTSVTEPTEDSIDQHC